VIIAALVALSKRLLIRKNLVVDEVKGQ